MKNFFGSLFNFEEKKSFKQALFLYISLIIFFIILGAIDGAIGAITNCEVTGKCTSDDASSAGFYASFIFGTIEIIAVGVWILMKKKALWKPKYLLGVFVAAILLNLQGIFLGLLPIIYLSTFPSATD